ncbi:hypothetical protein [Microbulbifer taiwanensis]|uniref:Uncharacterized protein n=1 Tax=Microbulbifer taiwanensis TaxID=986746 RepID=A0ABW1YLK7_9GAMM|nr:hypothetical protein [Microbulbifer taiwanensis]
MDIERELERLRNSKDELTSSTIEKLSDLEKTHLKGEAEICADHNNLREQVVKQLTDVNQRIDDWFSSDEFMKVTDPEMVQYDSEVRAELSTDMQWFPKMGCDVVRFSAFDWNPKKARAALRQDPDKHLKIVHFMPQDIESLREIAIEDMDLDSEINDLCDERNSLQEVLDTMGPEKSVGEHDFLALILKEIQ